MERPKIDMNAYDYPLPEERIAKFPLAERSASKLLVYRNGSIGESRFDRIGDFLPAGSLLVGNNTRVIRARIILHKASGARIEIFCLEPRDPADYERAFAVQERCTWSCIVGNLRKWKEGPLELRFDDDSGTPCRLRAERVQREGREQLVRFGWTGRLTFGQLLERLGRIPIPPYLRRESEAIDNTRYQTVYSKIEGSVAAPTAGLHFTPELIASLGAAGCRFDEVTLHVGAGTFLPVKEADAARHTMHVEHFEVTRATLRRLRDHAGRIVAIGTTSVRTLESLPAAAWRLMQAPGAVSVSDGVLDAGSVGQWDPYALPDDFTGTAALDALLALMEQRGADRLRGATQIMITPAGYRFRIVDRIITNFHQPKSTLLLLVSAYAGGDWRRIYDYALAHDFRFLSYGDSSLLINEKR